MGKEIANGVIADHGDCFSATSADLVYLLDPRVFSAGMSDRSRSWSKNLCVTTFNIGCRVIEVIGTISDSDS